MLKYIFSLFILIQSITASSQKLYDNIDNIDAEKMAAGAQTPIGWIFGFDKYQRLAYDISVDKQVKKSGNHSISIEKNSNGNTPGVVKAENQMQFAAMTYPIHKTFQGQEIVLKGSIKTENVKTGNAGLWMRIDGGGKSIAFDNMQSRGVKQTTDWQEYTIKLNYDSDQAQVINIGGLLIGDGKAWFDSFELYIDGRPISQATEKKVVLTKAALDTAFSNGSGIATIDLSKKVLLNLEMAGQFWSFVKYYHPAIARGDYNWDAELFRHLPKIIASQNNNELNKALDTWIAELPAAGPPVTSKTDTTDKKIAIRPNYGKLFDKNLLSQSLIDKLTAVKLSKRQEKHHYISFMPGIGNPKFENERSYPQMKYPDAGYRLLCLYRYWAMINYFFPYKDVMDQNWNDVLLKSITPFVQAKDEKEHILEVLKLIATVQDTHANIFSREDALIDFKGSYKAPFNADFIENKLVVVGFPYGDTLQVKQMLKIGDVISGINGKPVEALIKHYLPFTAASNYDTQLRNMPYEFLLRGHAESFLLDIEEGGKTRTQSIKAIQANHFRSGERYPGKQGYQLLNQDIGYIFPAKYKNNDLPAIKELFKNTKGMIIDLRCYPSDFMPFTFGSYIKGKSTPFVKFSRGELSLPGLFTYSSALNNGGGGDSYQGKIVVIVNSSTQSQAEYTTMAFQSDPNVTVIGSTTSGADGNVSTIILPGGISTMISGIGVFYPDGTPTQRVGVKIDKLMKPTIKGIREGRDELLEAAKQIINQ